MFTFEPAEQNKDWEIEDEPPKPRKFMVQPSKAAAMPRAINPVIDSDDDLTPPGETPPSETPPAEILPPKPRISGSTGANLSITMMIEKGPKNSVQH